MKINAERVARIFVMGLTTVLCASANGITDFSQLAGSAFGMYGLVAQGPLSGNSNNNLQLTNDTHINGNIAIYPDSYSGSNFLSGGGDVVNGNIDDAGANIAGMITNTTVTGAGHAISYNVATASNAAADALSLYGAYTALPVQNAATVLTTSNLGTTTISGQAAYSLNVSTLAGASFSGNTNENVYTVTSTALNANHNNLLITASASQYVIINVTAGGNNNFQLGDVALSGGITSDHVLLNVVSNGQLSATSGDIANAVIIDGGGSVNADAETLNGRLACVTTNGNCQVVSGFTINSTADVAATPEPMSFVLTGSGLLLAFAFRRKFQIY